MRPPRVYFRQLFRILLALPLLAAGCATVPDTAGAPQPVSVSFSARQEDSVNPLYVETSDSNYLWEAVVDVIDDYFPVPREYPIQTYRSRNDDGTESVVRTEGRIDTDPVIAAGVLQPWNRNSVTLDARLEATLQSIRRSANVRVVPEGDGFLVHVAVYNEIENLPQPMNSGANGSNLLFSDDLTKLQTPRGSVDVTDGWIPNGRDYDMEQYIIRQIAWRLKNAPEVLNPENAAAGGSGTIP